MRSLDIIIPTFNNPEYLNPCVESILKMGVTNDLATLWIVNNGKQDIKGYCGHIPNVNILEPGENLGWEGGLKYALDRCSAPFVCFQNDDTFLPKSSLWFYEKLLIPFSDPNVAAVGPSTTVAAGLQSIYHPMSPRHVTEVSYLIYFTVMVRRSNLDEVGGVDTTLPGGDDFDLSMRFKKAGKYNIFNPDAFIIHHGFKTGIRVRGDASMQGGWNSPEMSDRTNQALIRKHGFKSFIKTLRGFTYAQPEYKDSEGDVVRQFLNGDKKVLELGCGGKKTVPYATGVDWAANGERCSNLINVTSAADIQADVSKSLPFQEGEFDSIIARHIFEHMVDSVGVVKNWHRVLKPGGKLIIAVPDQEIMNTIPLNHEHVHAFTSESLKNLIEACGFVQKESRSSGNGVSFVSCFEKAGLIR